MSQPAEVIMTEPMSTSPSGGNLLTAQNPQSIAPAIQQVSIHPSRDLHPAPQSGMDILARLNNVLVKQHYEPLEIIWGIETNNIYSVYTGAFGNQFLDINEATGCCSRFFCGPKRPFLMHISDFFGNQFTVKRNYPWCREKVTVFGPEGQVIGTIVQLFSLCHCPCCIKYKVLDDCDEIIFRIEGNGWDHKCFADVIFSILGPEEEEEIGSIKRKYAGGLQEIITDADNFFIKFPRGATVNHKLTFLGAFLLIDFMFFESRPCCNGGGNGRELRQLMTGRYPGAVL